MKQRCGMGLVLALMLVAPGALFGDALSKELAKGQKLLAAGKYPKAVKVLEAALDAAPTVPAMGHLTLALALNQADEPARALVRARQALAVAEDPYVKASASAELMLALARTGEITDELTGAGDRVRAFLAAEVHESGKDGLRVRLCRARSFVPPPHRMTLAESNLGHGDVAALAPDSMAQEATTPPQRIHSPTPSAGANGRRFLGEKEMTILRTLIDVDGCVTQIKTLHTTSDAWEEVSRRAMGQWVFEPAREADTVAAVWYNFTINYRISYARAPAGGDNLWGPWHATRPGDVGERP